MKKLTALFLIFALVISLVSCGKSYENNSIGYESAEIPDTFDPLLTTKSIERTVVFSIFEPLMLIQDDGSAASGACESYSVSSDNLVYTFKLRSDAQWTDGQPVTASDFVFALQRAADPVTKWSGIGAILNILNAREVNSGKKSASELGVSAPDQLTLEIRLSAEDDGLIYTLGGAAGIPCRKDYFEEAGGKYGLSKAATISNGPFHVSSWNKDQGQESLKISRNSRYAGSRKAVSSSIVFSYEKNEGSNTLLQRLDTSNSDGGDITVEYLSSAADNGNTLLSQYSSCYGLFMNKNDKTLANTALCSALAVSIDRSAFSGALPQYLKAAYGFIPPDTFAADKLYRTDSYQPLTNESETSAAEYFQNAEAKLGKKDSISTISIVYCDEFPDTKTIINYLVQHWQKLFGISFEITAASKAKIVSMINSGSYQLAVCPVSADENSAVSWLKQFTSDASSTFSGLGGTEYDKLFAACPGSTDAQLAAEKYLCDSLTVTPLFFSKSYSIFSSSVVNAKYNLFTKNIDFTKIGKY